MDDRRLRSRRTTLDRASGRARGSALQKLACSISENVVDPLSCRCWARSSGLSWAAVHQMLAAMPGVTSRGRRAGPTCVFDFGQAGLTAGLFYRVTDAALPTLRACANPIVAPVFERVEFDRAGTLPIERTPRFRLYGAAASKNVRRYRPAWRIRRFNGQVSVGHDRKKGAFSNFPGINERGRGQGRGHHHSKSISARADSGIPDVDFPANAERTRLGKRDRRRTRSAGVSRSHSDGPVSGSKQGNFMREDVEAASNLQRNTGKFQRAPPWSISRPKEGCRSAAANDGSPAGAIRARDN